MASFQHRAFLFALCLLILAAPALGTEDIVFSSLPNPNVYPVFIILERDELPASFVPARGGVAGLLALMRSGQADVCLLNHAPAQKMSQDNGWALAGPCIDRAVYLLSYATIPNREAIEELSIISALPGGSPDKLYQAGKFKNQPRFTDLYLAIQLFLKKDADALLLPEPFISQTVLKLRERGDTFTITDMQQLVTGSPTMAVNDVVVRRSQDVPAVRAALDRATTFIAENPREAAAIIAAGFQVHFHKPLPVEALQEALESGRLGFTRAEVGHQD